MPNSYATVPNILPGNVTIGGDLTVSGNTIRVGAAAPFTRVQKLPATGGAAFGYNVDVIASSADQAAESNALKMLAAAHRPFETRYASAGGLTGGDLGNIIGWSGVTVNVTGTVAATTVFSVTIQAGTLGINGGLRIFWGLDPTVQGAVSTSLHIRLGGVDLFNGGIAALGRVVVDGFSTNVNALNSQRSMFWLAQAGVAQQMSDAPTAVDTSVAKLLELVIQPGAVTDNWDSRIHMVTPVRSGG